MCTSIPLFPYLPNIDIQNWHTGTLGTHTRHGNCAALLRCCTPFRHAVTCAVRVCRTVPVWLVRPLPNLHNISTHVCLFM